MQKIILASQSPRRKQLLEWAEIPFVVMIKETDESYPENLTKENTAIHIAANKAKAVAEAIKNNAFNKIPEGIHTLPILAADTIVVLHDRIIGKPTDRNDAIQILHDLSGKTHQVITGVTIIHSEKSIAFADVTEVTFHPLATAQIEFYVDKYKPYDKAGAYAIQEWIGVTGIQSINGDFYNVMGLPVSRVVKVLKEMQ